MLITIHKYSWLQPLTWWNIKCVFLISLRTLWITKISGLFLQLKLWIILLIQSQQLIIFNPISIYRVVSTLPPFIWIIIHGVFIQWFWIAILADSLNHRRNRIYSVKSIWLNNRLWILSVVVIIKVAAFFVEHFLEVWSESTVSNGHVAVRCIFFERRFVK